jgi:cobalt-zinc-cadmium efflux system membrane fusion protein
MKIEASITLIVAASGLFLTACSRQAVEADVKPQTALPAAKSGQAVFAVDSQQLTRIRVAKVETAMVAIGSVSAPAKIEANANRLSHVVLPLAGRVTDVSVRIGDFVRQGQALLTVESPDADAATSTHLQSQSSVTTAKSALAKAQTDLDRQRDLYEHGAVPQKEVLNAQAVLIQAQAAVEQAETATEQARRRLLILGLSPGRFGQRVTVTAPISGKVLEMSIVNGEFRNDLSAPLMTIADLSSVWVTSDVPETSIRLVRSGEAIRVELDAYPGEKLTGRVTQISDTVDPQSRTIKVRAELPNLDGRLKPEMFGRMQLTEATQSRPVVPTAAVTAQDGRTFVWRHVSPGVFEKTAVTTGPQMGDRVAILSGIQATDSVVVDGVMLLRAD